ncbi:MAG: tetratricopeptide repeat protein [Terriglobales bacterium]
MMIKRRRVASFILSLLIASGAVSIAPVMRAQVTAPGTGEAASQPATPCGARVAATACAGQLFVSTSRSFLLDRDREKAALGYLKVAQLDPKYAPAWFNLGVLAEGSQKWVEARRYFEKYLEVSPNGPESKRAVEEIATLAPYAAGKVSPAEAKMAEYDASIQRARILMAAKLYREAVSESGHAQALDDSRWESYAVAALCMKRQNKFEQASSFEKLAEDRAPTEKRDQIRQAFGSN